MDSVALLISLQINVNPSWSVFSIVSAFQELKLHMWHVRMELLTGLGKAELVLIDLGLNISGFYNSFDSISNRENIQNERQYDKMK